MKQNKITEFKPDFSNLYQEEITFQKTQKERLLSILSGLNLTYLSEELHRRGVTMPEDLLSSDIQHLFITLGLNDKYNIITRKSTTTEINERCTSKSVDFIKPPIKGMTFQFSIAARSNNFQAMDILADKDIDFDLVLRECASNGNYKSLHKFIRLVSSSALKEAKDLYEKRQCQQGVEEIIKWEKILKPEKVNKSKGMKIKPIVDIDLHESNPEIILPGKQIVSHIDLKPQGKKQELKEELQLVEELPEDIFSFIDEDVPSTSKNKIGGHLVVDLPDCYRVFTEFVTNRSEKLKSTLLFLQEYECAKDELIYQAVLLRKIWESISFDLCGYHTSKDIFRYMVKSFPRDLAQGFYEIFKELSGFLHKNLRTPEMDPFALAADTLNRLTQFIESAAVKTNVDVAILSKQKIELSELMEIACRFDDRLAFIYLQSKGVSIKPAFAYYCPSIWEILLFQGKLDVSKLQEKKLITEEDAKLYYQNISAPMPFSSLRNNEFFLEEAIVDFRVMSCLLGSDDTIAKKGLAKVSSCQLIYSELIAYSEILEILDSRGNFDLILKFFRYRKVVPILDRHSNRFSSGVRSCVSTYLKEIGIDDPSPSLETLRKFGLSPF